MTAWTMERKESSSRVMSLACLATLVPLPSDRPTWAWFSAGASLVPSPVTATTWPCCCKRLTRRCLSVGRARDITFRPVTIFWASSSLIAANSEPVMDRTFPSPTAGDESGMRPIWRPISLAVSAVSPVTILTSMPACSHWRMASGTSSRRGSLMAMMASRRSSWATARVRMACCCHSLRCSVACRRTASVRLHMDMTISGAPFIYRVLPTVVDMYLRSVEKGSREVKGFWERSCW